jgi:hypothetical protein
MPDLDYLILDCDRKWMNIATMVNEDDLTRGQLLLKRASIDANKVFQSDRGNVRRQLFDLVTSTPKAGKKVR